MMQLKYSNNNNIYLSEKIKLFLCTLMLFTVFYIPHISGRDYVGLIVTYLFFF